MPPSNQQPMPPQNPPAPQPAPPPVGPALTPTPASPSPSSGMSKQVKLLIIIGAAVALVVLLALGWFVMNSRKDSKGSNGANQSAETADVRQVSWIEPINMPAAFEKTDESANDTKTFYYDDASTDCFITTDIAPFGTYSDYGETPRDVALGLEDEEGVTIAKNEKGPTLKFKDVDGKQEYSFETMQLTKDINIPDLDFNKENTLVAYKPFGVYGVSIGMTCKAETWEAQKAALQDLVEQFTLRTVR